jgi:SAM-dependent methyltransferase
MTASNYFQQGAATSFANFFGNAKRLRLLEHIVPCVNASQQTMQKKSLRMLDLGAGTGMHADYFAKLGHSVTAVDPVPEMLNEGKKLYQNSNLTFVTDSLPTLEKLGTECFDVIYSIAAWQYIKPEDRQAAMARTAELLLPGGTLVIVWPVPMSREFQFPLLHADLYKTIDVVNKSRPEDQQIKVSQGRPIIDPDERMGIEDKTQPVYFYTTMIQMPAVELQNTCEPMLRSKL